MLGILWIVFMTGFMNTVLMKSTLHIWAKWVTHFDFTTPKGIKITPGDEKKGEEYKKAKEYKKDEKKNKHSDIPLNFHIVYFGLWREKIKKKPTLTRVVMFSLTPSS